MVIEMQCSKCGFDNRDNAKFCNKCGHDLTVDVSLEPTTPSSSLARVPTSFADGRYKVKEFLGEGGKKKVYRAYDTLLDREVALALIKTEGLDEDYRTRIIREAQAMGRLGLTLISSPCLIWEIMKASHT